MKIIVINGPNLNLLGRRKTEIYGTRSFDEILAELRAASDYEVCFFQSNSEGEIITLLHEHGFAEQTKGIILNPGAYTHYSYAIADAIEAIPAPVVEVHISNIYAREEFRRKSVTAPYCRGCIAGFGLFGYHLALQALCHD